MKPRQLSSASLANGSTNSSSHSRPSAGPSADHFKLLVDSVNDYAIILLDPEGTVLSWNRGAETIKGYKADEIIGQHFSKFYPLEAVARSFPAEELARATADGRFEDE